jgi:hypothetical protein
VFREFMGLPAHALIVHAAVVFVPLAVVSAILYAVLPASRRYLWWVVLGLGVVAPLTAWAARLSGNEYKAYWLEHGASGEYLTNLDNHQAYGNLTSLWATGLGVVMLAMVLFLLPRPTELGGAPSTTANPVLSIGTAVVVVAVGAVTAYYVYKTGDAGAHLTHPDISKG